MKEKKKVFNIVLLSSFNNKELDFYKSIIIIKVSYFKTVGNAVVLVMFTTSVPWTLFASGL